MIDVDLTLLADAANVSADGKLNVLGEFNLLLADQPPWTLVGRSLVVRFTGHAGDAGQHTMGELAGSRGSDRTWRSDDGRRIVLIEAGAGEVLPVYAKRAAAAILEGTYVEAHACPDGRPPLALPRSRAAA